MSVSVTVPRPATPAAQTTVSSPPSRSAASVTAVSAQPPRSRRVSASSTAPSAIATP
jgi:hypothetical protein